MQWGGGAGLSTSLSLVSKAVNFFMQLHAVMNSVPSLVSIQRKSPCSPPVLTNCVPRSLSSPLESGSQHVKEKANGTCATEKAEDDARMKRN